MNKPVELLRTSMINGLISNKLQIDFEDFDYIENDDHVQNLEEEFELYISKHPNCGLKINRRTKTLEKSENVQKIAKFINELEAFKFEKYVALLIKIFGYELTYATKKSHDQGIDLVGVKKFKVFDSNRKSYLIGQAKKYETLVTTEEIRGFAGSILLLKNKEFGQIKETYKDILMRTFTSVEGIFATSFFFSSHADKLCDNAGIIALDFIDLVLLTEKAIIEKTLEIEDENTFHEIKTNQAIDKIVIIK